ncbi:MAG: A24 family peptidase [Planctomycetota bacterium]
MTLLLLLCLFLLTVAAVIDLATREIPDWIPVLVVILVLFFAVLDIANLRWWMIVSGTVLGFGLGWLMFHWAHFGGGDAKLIVAVGAVLGPLGLVIAMVWMALAGGLLGLIAMARGQKELAYGPAIALGYLGYLIWPTGLLPRLMQSATIGITS